MVMLLKKKNVFSVSGFLQLSWPYLPNQTVSIECATPTTSALTKFNIYFFPNKLRINVLSSFSVGM